MNSTFLKGLFMAIITVLATAITTTGFPSTVVGWEVLGITTVGTTLVYLAKNAVFPSVSLFGTINIADLVSGLVLAIGTGLSSWAASAITSTPISWNDLLHLVLTTAGAYLASKFGFGKKTA